LEEKINPLMMKLYGSGAPAGMPPGATPFTSGTPGTKDSTQPDIDEVD
jgi:hypothetical protein